DSMYSPFLLKNLYDLTFPRVLSRQITSRQGGREEMQSDSERLRREIRHEAFLLATRRCPPAHEPRSRLARSKRFAITIKLTISLDGTYLSNSQAREIGCGDSVRNPITLLTLR